MTEQNKELTREELEEQDGEQLPPREVMSLINPDLGPPHFPIEGPPITEPRPEAL